MKKLLLRSAFIFALFVALYPVQDLSAQVSSEIFTDFEINNKIFRVGGPENVRTSMRRQWGSFNLIDAQDNVRDVRFDGKKAIHTVMLDGGRKSEDFLMTLRNVSTNKYKRVFKANFTANIKTKEEIEFMRNLGENGYSYVVELKAGKQTWGITYSPKDLKNLFQWNQ